MRLKRYHKTRQRPKYICKVCGEEYYLLQDIVYHFFFIHPDKFPLWAREAKKRGEIVKGSTVAAELVDKGLIAIRRVVFVDPKDPAIEVFRTQILAALEKTLSKQRGKTAAVIVRQLLRDAGIPPTPNRIRICEIILIENPRIECNGSTWVLFDISRERNTNRRLAAFYKRH